MKQIIAVITVLGFFIGSTGYASIQTEQTNTDRLIELLNDARASSDLNMKKITILNLALAYGVHNVKNPKLKEELVKEYTEHKDLYSTKDQNIIKEKLDLNEESKIAQN